MRRDVFVYLSGPMTAKDGYTVEENTAAGLRVFLECILSGIPAFCPHLCGGYPSAWSVPWDAWLHYDKAVIDRCTHVLMLPRWTTSEGAKRERAYALDRGVPVIYTLDDLSPAIEVQ